MGKHTPGPWKWDESWGAIMTDHNNPSRLISPVWTGCNPRGMGPEAEAEDAANARLIAAAPDLLEACNAAKNCAHFGHPGEPRPVDGRVYITADALNTICAAIAKATA